MKSLGKKTIVVIRILMALFLIYGGIMHFANVEFYMPYVPDFLLHKKLLIYGSGVAEILVGIGLLIKRFVYLASLLFLLMMLAFLPIHIADIFIENPAIGSHKAAYVRLPIQLIFIFFGYKFIKLAKSQ